MAQTIIGELHAPGTLHDDQAKRMLRRRARLGEGKKDAH